MKKFITLLISCILLVSSCQKKQYESINCDLPESELASIEANKAEQQKAEGTCIERGSGSNSMKMSEYMNFVFPILGICVFIMIVYFSFIRNIQNKISEIGYAMGAAKNAVDELKQKVKVGEVDRKILTNEEKKSIEFLESFLNN